MNRQVFSVPWAIGLAFASAGLLCAAAAHSQPAPAELEQRQTRALAATCAACHGTDGHAVASSAIPPLAGLTREQFTERMLAFRDGSLRATVMHQISKGYQPAQIDALAGWFAAQGRAP